MPNQTTPTGPSETDLATASEVSRVTGRGMLWEADGLFWFCMPDENPSSEAIWLKPAEARELYECMKEYFV